MAEAGIITWEACLAHLAERDGSVELTAMSTSAHTPMGTTYKVRLLALREGGMVVDRPAHREEARFFQPGALVRLLASQGPARWELMTHVLARVKFKLNDQAVVGALVLARPHEVHRVQRREFFRVSAAGVEMHDVRLSPISPPLLPMDSGDTDDRAALLEQPVLGPLPALADFKGHLVNIGGGGMGVEAPRSASFTLEHALQYHCQLDLPSDQTTLKAIATRVHLVKHDNGSYYMGLRFDTDSDHARHALEDRICQFTTWLQRQQLQRMREKR